MNSPWYVVVFQVFLVACGLVGAFTRALLHREDYAHWPDLDLVTIAWLGVAVMGFILPSVSEVGFGEVSVKIKRLRKASSVYEISLDSLANLVQNWSVASALFVEKMSTPDDQLLEPKADTYKAYIRDRMGEAYEMLATKKDERVRLGLWLLDPVTEKIVFAQGFARGIGARPKRTEYAPGEGMIGRSFVENRHFNEADVRNVPSYVSSREPGEELPYRAVLCEPIRWGNDPIGMITVDRSTEGFFDSLSIEIAQGLGAQCALAVKAYQLLGEE